MASTYRYGVIKSSWGVSVEITAEVSPQIDEESIRVTEHLFLCKPTGFGLIEEDRYYLVQGLRLVADKIQAHTTIGKPIAIRVLKVEFSECDYQPEGLACAIAGWAAQEFGFEPPTIPVTFDRQNNRYNFEFPELVER